MATERGTVVVACAEHVVSLEPDGSTRWEVEIGHAVRASPVALGDRDEVAVVAVGGRCCFLSADTGALLGQVDLGGKVTASPALSGGTLAVGTRGGDAFGIDVATRQVRWTTPHQAPRDHTSFTVLPDGAFLAANQRGDLVALEVEDGRFRWETTQLLGLSEHDPAIDITPVAEPDGSMYSGSYSGVLYHHRFRPQADPLAAPVETTAAPALARRVSGLVGRAAGDGPGSSTADGWPSWPWTTSTWPIWPSTSRATSATSPWLRSTPRRSLRSPTPAAAAGRPMGCAPPTRRRRRGRSSPGSRNSTAAPRVPTPTGRSR